MNFLSLVTLCGVWFHLNLVNAQGYPEYPEELDPGGMYPEEEVEEDQRNHKLKEAQRHHNVEEAQHEPTHSHEEGSRDIQPDDNDSHLVEYLEPYVNRGPPTRGETYKYAATMYTHLYLTRKTVPRTKRPNATVTATVLWDQYFMRNRLKSKIRVNLIKTHYRKEYRDRLSKMVGQCVGGLLLNCSGYSWDQLMDEYRHIREEQMIAADDRLFGKFVRRMDTVLQSGRYEKWEFHKNTTHKPYYKGWENLLFTDRIDKHMIMEIRSLARLLRKDIHKYFDILDNQFLRAYFRIPYNISLYYRYPKMLNYTEQF